MLDDPNENVENKYGEFLMDRFPEYHPDELDDDELNGLLEGFFHEHRLEPLFFTGTDLALLRHEWESAILSANERCADELGSVD